MNVEQIDLYDIKPLVDIQDHSFEWMIALIIAVVVAIVIIGMIIWRIIQPENEKSLRQKMFHQLASVDFDNPKMAAYEITRFGRCFSQDSERMSSTYIRLVERLEPYKYRKNVSDIDEETCSYYEIYLGMIDV